MREHRSPMCGRDPAEQQPVPRRARRIEQRERSATPVLSKMAACESRITRSPTARPLRPVGSAKRASRRPVGGGQERAKTHILSLSLPYAGTRAVLRLRGSQAFPGTNREERIKIKNGCRCRVLAWAVSSSSMYREVSWADARSNSRYLQLPPAFSPRATKARQWGTARSEMAFREKVTIARISTRLCIPKPSLSLLFLSPQLRAREGGWGWLGENNRYLSFSIISRCSSMQGILSWRAANPPGRKKKEREGGPVSKNEREKVVRAGLSEFLRIVRASPVAASRVEAKARIGWGIARMRQKSACHVSAL